MGYICFKRRLLRLSPRHTFQDLSQQAPCLPGEHPSVFRSIWAEMPRLLHLFPASPLFLFQLPFRRQALPFSIAPQPPACTTALPRPLLLNCCCCICFSFCQLPPPRLPKRHTLQQPGPPRCHLLPPSLPAGTPWQHHWCRQVFSCRNCGSWWKEARCFVSIGASGCRKGQQGEALDGRAGRWPDFPRALTQHSQQDRRAVGTEQSYHLSGCGNSSDFFHFFLATLSQFYNL